jgi:hypothetical protein
MAAAAFRSMFGGNVPMIVVHEDGSWLDWPKRLDALADLDRWRRYLELSQHSQWPARRDQMERG